MASGGNMRFNLCQTRHAHANAFLSAMFGAIHPLACLGHHTLDLHFVPRLRRTLESAP